MILVRNENQQKLHVLVQTLLAILFPLYSLALQASAIAEEATVDLDPVTITIRSKNPTLRSVLLGSTNLRENYLHEKEGPDWMFDVPLENGLGTEKLDLNGPTFFTMIQVQAAEIRHYALFISPGDQLEITIPETIDGEVVVTGKGSENNQLLGTTMWVNNQQYEKDTLPDRKLNDLRTTHREDSLTLEAYIRRHNPTAAFINAQRINLQYVVLNKFYGFFGNHKYKLEKNPNGQQLLEQWNDVVSQLIKASDIDNAEALVTPSFTWFVGDFLLRKKEALWDLRGKDSIQLANEWFDGDLEAMEHLFMDDPQNLLTEKIINRYFTGETAAFAYAHLIGDALGRKEDNLPLIYDRFKVAYPANPYLVFLEPAIEALRTKALRTLTEGMIFADENGSFTTFEQVLELVKGKTALLDMWGTWCAPCRQEIDQNSLALKDHFMGRGVDFIYVANYDLGKPEKWKELIAYYSLEGTHILASPQLTEDIQKKVGRRRFPTYVVIRPDGSYELAKAGYPMNRDELIKQLEEATNL